MGGNNDHFELEESAGSKDHFKVIYRTNNLASPVTYDIQKNFGKFFYRVRALDMGHWTSYSNIVEVKVYPPCPAHAHRDQTGQCICDDGYLPDPIMNICVANDVDCPAQMLNDNQGHCISDEYWVVCLPSTKKLAVIHCDGTPCVNLARTFGGCQCNEPGSKTCYSLNNANTKQNQFVLSCLSYKYNDNTIIDIFSLVDCVGLTNSAAGSCGAYVTAGGYIQGCFCDINTCTMWSNQSCDPVCADIGMSCVKLNDISVTCQ